MSLANNIAEATALTGQGRKLWQRSYDLTLAEFKANGLTAIDIPADHCCEAGRPLRAQAQEFYARAAELRGHATTSHPAASAALSQKVPSMTATSDADRIAAIRAIADANAAQGLTLPAGMVENAIASRTSLEKFIVDADAHLTPQRQRIAEGRAADQMAADVVSFIPGAKPLAALKALSTEEHFTPVEHMTAEDKLVADIAAFIPADRRAK